MTCTMTCTTSTKIICILIYSCAVVVVPPIPNLYTFTVNCLAYTVTIAVSVFVIYFLNTRPSSNKNLLNRILILSAAMLICKSTRDFLVSFVACFWNCQLSKMMEIYPGVIFLLATRYIPDISSGSSKLVISWKNASFNQSCFFSPTTTK